MTLPNIALWCKRKGINLVGTGDFTHPAHFSTICDKLIPAENGLFTLKENKKNPTRFLLTSEVSNIYKEGNKTRKIHNLIFSPSLKATKKINKEFAKRGNVASDGRPIFGFTAKELLSIVLDADPECMLIPAHAWTPWFSLFGSKSGFDSIEECFGDLSKHIFAIETGLSSNPEMNRRISGLDNITLISNSDAHSLPKLGREVNVFESDMDYFSITKILRENDKKKFPLTIEFHPEEGKYHHDGHRECGVLYSPTQTKKAMGLCSVCGKAVTVGVANRIDELADRTCEEGRAKAAPSKALVPLQEIIAEALGRGFNTKGVTSEYLRITDEGESEFNVLLNMDESNLKKIAGERITEGIIKARTGELSIVPGFDGEFGKVKLFEKLEQPKPKGPEQKSLL